MEREHTMEVSRSSTTTPTSETTSNSTSSSTETTVEDLVRVIRRDGGSSFLLRTRLCLLSRVCIESEQLTFDATEIFFASRTGLVAYHILQTGDTCRLPKTPRTPRGIGSHYFVSPLLMLSNETFTGTFLFFHIGRSQHSVRVRRRRAPDRSIRRRQQQARRPLARRSL
jgi:hypothetical protein